MKRIAACSGADDGRTSKVKWPKRVIERSHVRKAIPPSRQENDTSDTNSMATAADSPHQRSRLLDADLNASKLGQEKLARTRAACQAAITPVELLENVLLHLPPNDIVNATRVCQRWNDVVNSSVALRPKLFRTLYNSGEVWHISRWDGMQSYGTRTSEVYDVERFGQAEEHLIAGTLNPLFRSSNFLHGGCLMIKPRGHTMKQAIEEYLKRQVKEQGRQGGAILDGMHFTDGPAPKIEVSLNWRVREVVGYALVSLPFKKAGWTVAETLRMVITAKHLTSWDDHARHCGGSERCSLIDLFAHLQLDGPDFEIECEEVEFRLQSLFIGAGGRP